MGSDVIFEGGSDQLILRSGSVAGSVFMDAGPGNNNGANGSDTALVESTFNLGAFTGTFDGGDDTSSLDGLTDVLTLRGQAATVNGANFINWETVIVDGGSLSFGPSLSVGSDAGTGLRLINGGSLGAAGVFALTGNLSNSGVIALQNGAAGDSVNVSGDYVGGGQLHVDVDFATNTADTLMVSGNVTGTTAISVTNLSSGTPTGNNVVVVDVTGTTAANDFTLAGGPVAAGAYSYNLNLLGRQWVLASLGVNAVGSVYESAPFVLGRLVDLQTFANRIGNRQYLTPNTGENQIVNGAWLRTYGHQFDITLTNSTSGSAIDGHSGGLQFGYDLPATATGAAGTWAFGVTGQYGVVTSLVANALGTGRIKAKGYGFGATGTWYGNGGLYFDAQAQVNWLKADYTAGTTILAANQDAMGYGLSAEIGKRFALRDTASLIPQAQLVWSRIESDTFNDSAGSAVDLGNTKRLIGRLGLSFENAYPTTDGGAEKYYVIGNLFHDFSRASRVNVAGAVLAASDAESWAEIGLGGSKSWDKKSHIFAEASYRKSLNATRSSNLGLTAGFSIKW